MFKQSSEKLALLQKAIQTHKENTYNVSAGVYQFKKSPKQPLFNYLINITLTCSPLLFQAIHGQAIDRHLLGLKRQSIEDLTSIPEIFMDTSYAVANHFNLSTSQVYLHLRKATVCYC